MGYPVIKKTTALHRDLSPGILLHIVYEAYDRIKVVNRKTGEVVAGAVIVKDEGRGEDRVTSWGLMIPTRPGSYREVDSEDLIQSLRKLVGIYEQKAA